MQLQNAIKRSNKEDAFLMTPNAITFYHDINCIKFSSRRTVQSRAREAGRRVGKVVRKQVTVPWKQVRF